MFDTGITWLRQEIDSLRRHRQHRQALLKSVEEIVEIVDPIIRLARSYRKTLLPSVETAVTYCNRLVKLLPGPVRLHRSSYHDDPLVKALFLSPDEMENILRNARNAGIPGTGQEVFALLTMTKTEKTVYGHKQQGEIVLRDVPMQAVTFIDHRVVAPAADLQETEIQLQQRSLEILASVAMEKIASLRANLAELRERRARLSSMHRILCGKRCTFEMFAQPEQENVQKVNELKTLLSETEKEIELARKEIDTPDDTMGHLVRLMDLAADILVLRQHSLRLNWMNVIVEEGDEDEYHQIDLAELTLNQELQRSAVLVSFDR